MFKKYADYMYSLLFAPLKKARRSVNQFYLFFKVIGALYDRTVEDIQRIREESMILTASEALLAEHGRDRNLPRLENETAESYRTRLAMKGILAEKAGTKEGIELCLESFHAEGEVIPYYTIDPERWAEFLVRIYLDMDYIYIPVERMREQVREVKPASAKDNYELVLRAGGKIKLGYWMRIKFQITGYSWQNQNPLLLNGTWVLDGSRSLNGYRDSKEVKDYRVKICLKAAASIRAGGRAEMICSRTLDGTWTLDASVPLEGGTYTI